MSHFANIRLEPHSPLVTPQKATNFELKMSLPMIYILDAEMCKFAIQFIIYMESYIR